MSTDKNKARKRRYCEAFNARDLRVFDELFAPGYVLHIAGSPDVRGAEALRQLMSASFRSLPDVQLTVDDMIAEGEKVVTRWTLRFTHSGEFLGVAPTHRQVTVTGLTVDKFLDERIVEAWEVFDALGMMRQMGAVPRPQI